MVNLKINNKEINVSKDLTILQAAALIDIQIPRFCFHDKLSIAGNCRMCLVEVLKVAKPIASCAMPVGDNMQIYTNSVLVKKAREGVLELLLANHPLDCPICDQGGECDLQDQAMIFGNDRGRFYENKRAVSDKVISPVIKTIMTRCIHCTRCVRFLNEIAGVNQLGVTGRGSSSEIGTYINNSLLSELSGNIIDLCPVGALTSKPYAFSARPWELRSVESIDIHDALGSNIRFDTRGGVILRVLPKSNEDLNEEWISDKIRFNFDGLKLQRLNTPVFNIKFSYSYNISYLKFNEISKIFLECTWETAFKIFRENFVIINKNFIHNSSIIFGNSVNLESLVFGKQLALSAGFNNILNQYSFSLKSNINNDFDFFYSFSKSPKILNNIDVCLLVGTNLRLENPLLNSRLRKSFLKNNTIINLIGPTMEPIYNLKKIGNSLQTLVLFLEGKLQLNCFLKTAINPIILLGSNFKYNSLLKNLYLLKKYNSLLFISFISPYISDLSFNTFFNNNITTSLKKEFNFYYFVDCDEIILNKSDNKNFVVYQGSIGDRTVGYADLILPSLNFSEEHSSFFDIMGNVQYTNIANQTNPLMARTSWKIFIGLELYFESLKTEKKNTSKFIEINCLTKSVINTSKLFLNLFCENKNISKQSLFIKVCINNKISNFYMTNSIGRVSKIMGHVSQNRISKFHMNLMHS